ncbi:ubiquitin-conjugating enzyme E2 5A [Trichonephila clavipes]|nr:ubiquitin-conjugating enzyme E2 5A [Trichonephila clavipes]
MEVVQRRKNLPVPRQWYVDSNEDHSRVMLRSYFYQQKLCHACSGFYGPNFEQPLCVTCHAFLYPDDVNIADGSNVPFYREKSNSDDSGNEEPSDFYETRRRQIPLRQRPQRLLRRHPRLNKLSDCITALISPKRKENVSDDLVENLPNEVLTVIFSYLDDFSLWNCSQVCKRWCNVVEANHPDEMWRHYTRRLWGLFRPTYVVPCWRIMYSKLAQSAPCILCLHQMAAKVEPPYVVYSSWRTTRLRNELKSLHTDPPEGIEALPLDEMCFHWQASIAGPVDSPYEGGLFYLYLQVPSSYPMSPPTVRFITKIFHPNVSRHGDIGIDSIHDNWSLILTISKILISIQSLLTDPYCDVCMEPEIGNLYQANRAAFDGIARLWTLRYAMLHKRPPILDAPSPYLSPENSLNPNL